jgi:hypothetical protein
MIVHTETGSVYEFAGTRVRRVNGGSEMRRDGEWLRFRNLQPVTVGQSMRFMLEPLGVGGVTFRTTSRVTRIEESPDDPA